MKSTRGALEILLTVALLFTTAGQASQCNPEPEVCGDGIDNDEDGSVDCWDADCGGQTACALRDWTRSPESSEQAIRRLELDLLAAPGVLATAPNPPADPTADPSPAADPTADPVTDPAADPAPPPTWTCPSDDPAEPNDSAATAATIAAGATFSGVVCPGDDDWFAVTAEPGCVVRGALHFADADGDLHLQLQSPSGAQLAASYGSTDDEVVQAVAPAAGRHVFHVYGFQGAWNRYDFRATVTCAADPPAGDPAAAEPPPPAAEPPPPAAEPPPPAAEPDARPAPPAPATCANAATLSCGATVTGTTAGGVGVFPDSPCGGLAAGGPEAYYAFTATASGSVTFRLSGLAADLDLFVLDGGCTADRCAGRSATLDAESVAIDVLAGRTYAVVVDGFRGAAGAFSLSATCAATPAEDCADGRDDDGDGLADCADPGCAATPACVSAAAGDDAYEPNDDIDHAAEGVTRGTGLLARANDDDWYAVPVCAGGTVSVHIDFAAATGDLDLVLLDAARDELAAGLSSTDDEDVSWSNDTGRATTIFAGVTAFLGESNAYDLVIDVSGC